MLARPWLRFYDDGVPHEIAFAELTLPQFLERAAARFPESPALYFFNARITYGELKDQVDRLATALAAMEVGRDTRVAVHLPNLPQTTIAVFATLSLGAVVVMTNPLWVAREIEELWRAAGCTVAVTTDVLYQRHLAPVSERLGIRHYIVAAIADYLPFPLRIVAPWRLRRRRPPLAGPVPYAAHIHLFRKLLRRTPAVPPRANLAMDDAAVIQSTGGTTGRPRCALLTHGNLSCNVQQLSAWFPALAPGGEVFLSALPQFHIFGFNTALLLPVHLAAASVLLPDPRDIRAAVRAIARHRVTLFPGVPAMFRAVCELPGIRPGDLRSIKWCFSGGAPLTIELLQRFEELTGAKLAEGYGLTEASPVTHLNPLNGVRKVGSIGIPLPGTDARIVDIETGRRTLGPGEEGELIVRGPQVMRGYLDDPRETNEMLRDGWLHTGDLAIMDEEGYVTLVGRKKEMILASGYNVYPDEVDRVLMTHPDVLEACTIGVPDPGRGETVKSFVVRRPGSQVTAEEIAAFCRERLAPYKIPRLIDFRESLPRSSMFKFLRRVLRDEELVKLRTRNGERR